ncbi:GntR family transcriptional regulator [Streptomyces sp. MK37H]|nr:GntR family transcriptional regulator [Streptomyces sp. MK37H]
MPRDALLAGPYRPGDRVREAPLAARLGLSRRVVRAGLRALAEEGMLDPLPGGATAVPAVTAKDVLDLSALRAGLGALLIRRVAMLGSRAPHPGVGGPGGADALVRTADLPQAAQTFERLTAGLRRFVTVLRMDYSQACDTITNEGTAVYDALRNADGNEAARLWRVKIERPSQMAARMARSKPSTWLWASCAALSGSPATIASINGPCSPT